MNCLGIYLSIYLLPSYPLMHHQQLYHMHLYGEHSIATLLFLMFENGSMRVHIVAIEMHSVLFKYI